MTKKNLIRQRSVMKLYDTAGAPNPRRVRMFLAEKGIEYELQVNIVAGGKLV